MGQWLVVDWESLICIAGSFRRGPSRMPSYLVGLCRSRGILQGTLRGAAREIPLLPAAHRGKTTAASFTPNAVLALQTAAARRVAHRSSRATSHSSTPCQCCQRMHRAALRSAIKRDTLCAAAPAAVALQHQRR